MVSTYSNSARAKDRSGLWYQHAATVLERSTGADYWNGKLVSERFIAHAACLLFCVCVCVCVCVRARTRAHCSSSTAVLTNE